MAVLEYGAQADLGDEDLDYDQHLDEEKQLKDEDQYEDEESAEDDADPAGLGYNEIYYIEVADKQQGDQKGPIDYKEFKQRYQDNKNHPRLTYMSPMRDANEMPEWTQIFKCDKIFKDIDRKRYNEIKRKSKSNPKSNANNQQNGGGSGKGSAVQSSGGLAKPMSIQEMKAKERKEEEERLKNPEKDYEDRPMIESDASYHSDSCCIIL